MKNRETVFMMRKENWKCIRGLNIGNTDFFNMNAEAFHFYERDYNVYVSLATYLRIPVFTFNLMNRSKETGEWFSNNAIKSIINYDLLIDFDAIDDDNFKKMVKKVQNLIYALNSCNVCYSIYPSGNNFQILISGNNIEKHDLIFTKDSYQLDKSKNGYIYRLTLKIKERFELKYLDMSGIGQPFKIRKCRYSICGEKVCLPFNKEMVDLFLLDKFKYYDMNFYRVFKNYVIFKRGLNNLNDFGEKQNKINFKKFEKRFLK